MKQQPLKSSMPRIGPRSLACLLALWHMSVAQAQTSSYMPAQTLQTPVVVEPSESAGSAESDYTATLPTVVVEGTADTSTTKGYIGYQNASVTRDGLSVKESPRTIDVLNIQKNKNYGTNDLSSILEGNAGIDAGYGMRGENLYLRGFNIDANDIYRDGVRESGQVRRSTANIERVEILKGPASVLYGRTSGGGIVNMVG